jgi:hypothetical protein
MAYKKKVNVNNEISGEGTLIGIDEKGIHTIDKDGVEDILSSDEILGMFKGKNIKISYKESIKNEEEIKCESTEDDEE